MPVVLFWMPALSSCFPFCVYIFIFHPRLIFLFWFFFYYFSTFFVSLFLFVSHMELWLHKDDKPDWPDLIRCLWFLVLLCFVSGSSHSVIPFPIFCMFSCLSVIVSFFPCYILSPPISSFPLSVYTIYPFLRLSLLLFISFPFLSFPLVLPLLSKFPSILSLPSLPSFLPTIFLSFPSLSPPLTTCALWWFVPDIPPHVHTHTHTHTQSGDRLKHKHIFTDVDMYKLLNEEHTHCQRPILSNTHILHIFYCTLLAKTQYYT